MATATVRLFILTLLSCSLALGGVINVTNNATLTSANASAIAGDTIYLAIGPTYTVPIAPANPGSSGSPIVYMPASVGAVCSLYVTGSAALDLDGVDYIYVQDIRFRVATSAGGRAMQATGADHFLIQRCRFYGGTYAYGGGEYTAFPFTNAHYGRIYHCLFDRLDPVVANPSTDNQGDGISWYESSHLIFEYDTVRNVSHAGWYGPATRSGSTPAWAQLNGPVVMRNCVAYDCHNPYDLQNAGHTILMDGCKGWSPMVKSLDKGGHTTEIAIERSIMRYGMFYNDTTRTQSSGGMNNAVNAFIAMENMGPYGLRVYNNAFLGSPGDSPYAWALFISEDGNIGDPFGHSVYANNIIANALDTNLVYYQDNAVAHGSITDTLKGNLFWDGTPGGDIADIDSDEEVKKTLAAAKTYNSNFFQSSNIEASPLWVDSFSVRERRSFEISGTSLARDAGVALTRLRAGASSSTVLQVADAKYFWYPHSNPYDRGDSIAVSHSGVWTRCLVDSVDTTANNIIVHSAVNLSAGDSVYLLAGYLASTGTYTNRLQGMRPDIGPYEIASGGGTTIPSATTNVEPADGSTQAQPITFRWRTVSGATTYWLTASYDNWGHDHVSVQTADTFYTYSGFPLDTTVIWNVAAGNSAGWAAWSDVWDFRTQAAVTYGDTITVNWNNVFESETLTDNTVLQMANLQRRDNILVIKNPSGRLIDWPTTIRWPGRETAPQPPAGDTVAYWLVRDGSTVYGFELGAQGSGSGVSPGWVMQEIARNTGLFIAGEYQPILTGNNTSILGRVGTLSGADGTTLWYGHVDKTASGVLVYGYAYGGTQLRYRTSLDDGKTWSAFAIAHTVDAGHTTGGATFGITSAGVWVFLFSEDTAATPYNKNLYIRAIRSTNSGATWSVPTTIPTAMPFGITGGIAEFSDGTLITAYAEGFYGYNTLDATYGTPAGHDTTKIKVIKSTDGGATWGTPIVAYAHHDSVYQLNEPFLDEPAIAVDGSDNAVMICRTPDYGTGQLVSADQGETWTYKGIIGQTNCGPGVYSNNSSPDLLTLNDSTFMAVVGYRLNPDGPGTDAGKIGYLHILTGTWREIQDATFGWNTFVPPTYVEYGDAGAHRAVVADDTTLVMVQLQGGRTYRLTPAEIVKARANWLLSSKESIQFRPAQQFQWSDRIALTANTWQTLYEFDITTAPQHDSVTTIPVGAIPLCQITAHIDDGAGADTTWIRLVDVNDILMPSNNATGLYWSFPNGSNYSRDFPWLTWFPTKLRDASGNVVLGQFEKQVAHVIMQVKSTNGAVLHSVGLRFGYSPK